MESLKGSTSTSRQSLYLVKGSMRIAAIIASVLLTMLFDSSASPVYAKKRAVIEAKVDVRDKTNCSRPRFSAQAARVSTL